jgi:hypothetical protein
MDVATYTISFLADHGLTHAFLLTGGMAMYLNNALAMESRIKKYAAIMNRLVHSQQRDMHILLKGQRLYW